MEAYNAGKKAVQVAVKGVTDKMVGFERTYVNGSYKCNYVLIDLALVANDEKKIPLDWINPNGTSLNEKFVNYALPLIQGDMKAPLENGLPRFAKLKKILYK